MPKVIKTENHVKELLKKMLDEIGALHYPASAGAYSSRGISDRIACYKGRFIAIEAKKPGRRGEENEGLSALQKRFGEEVLEAGGWFFKVDDEESIESAKQILLSLK